MHHGQTPSRNPLMAEEMVALHANPSRHPKALDYEMRRVNMDTLVQLAYQEHGGFLMEVPYALAEAAYDEMERRQGALSRLVAACPALTAA